MKCAKKRFGYLKDRDFLIREFRGGISRGLSKSGGKRVQLESRAVPTKSLALY